jgi:hypothetical protein
MERVAFAHSRRKDCLFYESGTHSLHSSAVGGVSNGAPERPLMTASDTEQKLRRPVLKFTGVAATTYSEQAFAVPSCWDAKSGAAQLVLTVYL